MSLFRSIALPCTLALGLATVGQVYMDKPLIMTGDPGAARQVMGLSPSTDPTHAVTAGMEQRGSFRTALPLAGNAWQVDLPAFGEGLTMGSHLVVKVPTTTVGPVSITVNNAGPIALFRGDQAIDGNSLEEGSMLSVVFDGTVFQILNGRTDVRRTCPAGMIAVNDQFCIEPNERPATNFYAAAVACSAVDRRLCSWAEFHAACSNTVVLGLVGMQNNWEWTNNTANEDNSGRIVGLNDCTTASTWLATGSGPIAFRCCYTR